MRGAVHAPTTGPPAGARRLQGHRGIYLISTLLLLTFLVMLGGAIAVSFQQGLASSGSFNNRQMALGAAMSGLQYIQARLESNPTIYGPGYLGALTQDVLDAGGFKVREAQDAGTRGVNICGYLDNSIVAGAGDMPVTLLFRACFNSSYSTFAARPDRWTPIATFNSVDFASPPQGWPALGPMDYVSMNNILRSSLLPVGSSFRWNGTTGQTFKQVPGGAANVFVEGLVVRADGLIVARRMVECMYSLSGLQSPTAPGAASAALDMNIRLYQSEAAGGGLDVGLAEGMNASLAGNAGLAAYAGNIRLNGLDAATSTTAPPPGYSASSRASVSSDKAFIYAWGDGTQTQPFLPNDVNQTVVQAQKVAPPAIPVSALPTMPSASTVEAGTYVVWDDKVYRFPVDYNPEVPLIEQSWGGGTGASDPLTLNGTPGQQVTLPSGMSFSSSDNTLTVTKDVQVAQGSNSTTGFAFVVAPTDRQPAGASNSAEKGSAQLVFDATSGTSPQLRSEGNLSVVGNVTGQGAVVATGAAGTNTGNVTIIGKSALDTRSDSGVAVYARGSVTVQQLSYAQAPSDVPTVKDSLASLGVTAGSGNSTAIQSVNITDRNQAVYAAITQAIQKQIPTLSTSPYWYVDTNKTTVNLLKIPSSRSDYRERLGDVIKDTKITLTYNGRTLVNKKLHEVLDGVLSGTAADKVFDPKNKSDFGEEIGGIVYSGLKVESGDDDASTMQTVVPSLVSQDGWEAGPKSRLGGYSGWDTYDISKSAWSNYQSYGVPGAADASGVGATTGTTGTLGGGGTPSPGGASGSVTTAALNQTFAGLVYAGRDINIRNNMGSISVTGMMAAFGGDPNNETRPSGVGGSINLSANSVSLTYDPSTVGPYLYLFGGVKMQVTCLSNF